MSASVAFPSWIPKAVITMMVIIILVLILTYQYNAGGAAADVTPGGACYMDNNASTPMFPVVLRFMAQIMSQNYANPSSIHALGRASRQVINEARAVLAGLVGCADSEIVFTSGATESNNLIIRGTMIQRRESHGVGSKAPPPEIITTPIEHASTYQTISSLPYVDVKYTRMDGEGHIDLEHMQTLFNANTAMVCIIMGNNEIGTIQNIPAIAAMCKRYRVHLHCDMTQIFGKYMVNLKTLGVDSATMSAHKFHGPKGVGALYVRTGVQLQSCITGGGQEMSLRGGTENVAGIAGMAKALQECMKMISEKHDLKVRSMRDYIRLELRRLIPGMVVNGDVAHGLYNTLSVCMPFNSRAMMPYMDQHGIYINVGCACSKGDTSKVLSSIGRTKEQQEGSLRISLGFFNTMDQCRHLVHHMRTYYAALSAGPARIVGRQQ